jgi:uncharacterized protein YegL
MTSVVDKLNVGLQSLLDAMLKDSMAAAKVRLSIVAFNHEVRCMLDLADFRVLESMPTLNASGTTSYETVFRDLRARIQDDVDRLKQQDFQVHRPAIFFLTDGVPNANEDWQVALESLKDPSWGRRPNILAFGIGTADAAIVSYVASKPEYAFMSVDGTDAGAAIAQFMEALTQSIVTSGQALASGNAQLQIEPPAGFTVAIDTVE